MGKCFAHLIDLPLAWRIGVRRSLGGALVGFTLLQVVERGVTDRILRIIFP